MTWNLWWQFGPWEKRQAAIHEVIKDVQPDILCLQEVWADGDEYCAQQIAESLGDFNVAPQPELLKRREGKAFTNAIVSRWPITTSSVHRLPNADGAASYRTAVEATVKAPWGPQSVVTAHINHIGQDDADRRAQAQGVLELVSAAGSRSLLAGDLNATPDSPEINLFRQAGLNDAWNSTAEPIQDPGLTWATTNPYAADASVPNRRLDYVFVGSDFDVVKVGLAGTEPVDGVVASDHYGVWAELTVP